MKRIKSVRKVRNNYNEWFIVIEDKNRNYETGELDITLEEIFVYSNGRAAGLEGEEDMLLTEQEMPVASTKTIRAWAHEFYCADHNQQQAERLFAPDDEAVDDEAADATGATEPVDEKKIPLTVDEQGDDSENGDTDSEIIEIGAATIKPHLITSMQQFDDTPAYFMKVAGRYFVAVAVHYHPRQDHRRCIRKTRIELDAEFAKSLRPQFEWVRKMNGQVIAKMRVA